MQLTRLTCRGFTNPSPASSNLFPCPETVLASKELPGTCTIYGPNNIGGSGPIMLFDRFISASCEALRSRPKWRKLLLCESPLLKPAQEIICSHLQPSPAALPPKLLDAAAQKMVYSGPSS